VAGDPADRDQRPSLDLPDDADLERDPAAVAVAEDEPVGERLAGILGDLKEPAGRVGELREGDELRERVPDQLLRTPPHHLLGPAGVEGVPAPAVHLEDEVRRGLHERPVAGLRRAQVSLEAFALTDVADGALPADEDAVLPDADGADLRRQLRAVLALDD